MLRQLSRFFLPGSILAAAIFFRFYRLVDLFYFMIDEERYSFLMKRLYLDHKLMLAGVAIPGGIYLGPAYFYFSGLLQFISGFKPEFMAAVASTTGVLSTLGVFYLAQKFFGSRPAVIAMAIYAFSYLIVIYNRIYWTLTWSSLTALLTYWGLYQIITAKKFWYLYPMTALYILGSQSDASYFSLILTAIIILLTHVKVWSPFKRPLVISLATFFIAQLPLIAFDLRHGFYNTKLILNLASSFLTPSHFTLSNPLKSLLIFPQTLSRLLIIHPPYDVTYQLSPTEIAIASRQQAIILPLIILSAFILLVFIFKSWADKQTLAINIIKTHLLIAIAGVLLYSLVFPGYVHEWFLAVLFPTLALIIALLAELMIKSGWGWLVVPTLALILLHHGQALLKTDNAFGFGYKRQAVTYAINQVGPHPFYLDSIGSQAYGGYRYLFWVYGKEPVHSFMDNVYGNWIYPLPADHSPTNLGVVMVNLSRFEPETAATLARVNQLQRQALAQAKFGGIQVLILPSGNRP